MSAKELAGILSEKGLRPTQQRIAIYDYLLKHPTHPTAETIFRAVRGEYPALSLTTIYNSLHALARVGLIRILRIDAEEQHFDGDASDHAHFKCDVCGRIYDFAMDKQAVRHICPAGFRVDMSDVYFSGVCACCEANTLS